MKDHIHLIMPMGGGGTRFGNLYEKSKPLIELWGKPFFYWAAQSVTRHVEVADIIFVVLQEHVDRYGIDEAIKQFFPDAIIHVIPHILNGAVLTCMEGVSEVQDDQPILFNDCDHAFLCTDFYHYCERGDFSSVDGALLTFASDSPNFSYVRFDEAGNVVGTLEKQVVSREAICGAYYFRNRDIFTQYATKYLNNCDYKEFFISGVYNEMAKAVLKIRTFHTDDHISFGTPEEFEQIRNTNRAGDIMS